MTAPLHPGSRLGRYEIVKPLGSGAMGDVYLALDPQIDRHLAIKTVRPHGASQSEIEERRQRLLREAKAAGRLMHPHAVALFDAGEQEGLVYLAFEFVDGEPLDKRMLREPRLATVECLRLARQAASALAAAHDQGVVHRDIKPANILLTTRGDAKVADFGIAKMSSQATELTTAGTVIGSPQYMSPEQVRGEPLDGRTDQFSLGTLLYELLSRRRAFQGDTITTLVYLILHEDPVPLSELRPDLPERVVELVEKLMDKDREARFPSMREAAAEMEQIESELARSGAAELPLPPDFAGAPTIATRPSAAPPAPPSAPPPPGTAGDTGPTVVSGAQATATPLLAPPPPKRKSFPWLAVVIVGVLLLATVSVAGFFALRTVLSLLQGAEVVAEAGEAPAVDTGRMGEQTDPSEPTPSASETDLELATPEEESTAEVSQTERPSAVETPLVGTVVPDKQAGDRDRTEATPTQSRPEQTLPKESPPPAKTQPVPKEPEKEEPVKKEPVKKEPVKKEPAKKEPVQEQPSVAVADRSPPPVRKDPAPENEPPPATWDEDIQIDTRIVGGSQLYLEVEPKNVAKETFLQVKALGDSRFTHAGRYWDYRESGFALPSTGRHLVRLRADGYRDWVAEVDVQPGKASARLSVTMKR